MIALLLGLLAGAMHVLSGPDHLAAVAPLSVRRDGWRTGLVWGIGHTSGVWVVACAGFLAQHLIALGPLASWGQRLAGGALILVGLWTLIGSPVGRALRKRWPVGLPAPLLLRAAALIGILHGLAGSTHYLGVLPAFTFSDLLSSTAYLFGFGLATVATVTAGAWGLGRAAQMPRVVPALRGLSGAAAVTVGLLWVTG